MTYVVMQRDLTGGDIPVSAHTTPNCAAEDAARRIVMDLSCNVRGAHDHFSATRRFRSWFVEEVE